MGPRATRSRQEVLELVELLPLATFLSLLFCAFFIILKFMKKPVPGACFFPVFIVLGNSGIHNIFIVLPQQEAVLKREKEKEGRLSGYLPRA